MMTDTVRKRRRHAPEFKAAVVAACLAPGASVARIAREHDLNANLVQTWIRKARQQPSGTHDPAFVPLKLPASSGAKVATAPQGPMSDRIRIEIPRPTGALVVEWPASHAEGCLALLLNLLR